MQNIHVLSDSEYEHNIDINKKIIKFMEVLSFYERQNGALYQQD